MSDLAPVLKALRFAARKHGGQLRKGDPGHPYIDHPIAVIELLARCGVDDVVTIQAAALHDTIEDTDTTPQELAAEFGVAVRDVVLEVSDEKSLPKEERKRRQIEHAPSLSDRAKRIKLADKTCNVLDVAFAPPRDWSETRRADYLAWAEAVVRHCLGVGPVALEDAWHEARAEAREAIPSGGRV